MYLHRFVPYFIIFVLIQVVSALPAHAILASGTGVNDYEGLYQGVGNYGLPPSLFQAATAKDREGRLYLFGGDGFFNQSTMTKSNHLWRYDRNGWVLLYAGSKEPVYGVQGEYAPENNPGARILAGMVVDSTGLIWISGGLGYIDSGETNLDDIWVFNGTQWAFMYGLRTTNYAGNFSDQGIASPNNHPPAKYAHATWIDADDNIWTFGGSRGVVYNDLWMFDGTLWTWVRGGVDNPTKVDGNELENTPGSNYIFSYQYFNSHLYLYGGYGMTASGLTRVLNMLWKFNGTVWTLLSGSPEPGAADQPNWEYEKGVRCGSCTPGVRRGAAMSVASENSIYVGFGGFSYRDVWHFNGSEWAWVGGYNGSDLEIGRFFSEEGLADITGTMFPGPREFPQYWSDDLGNLWIYGGWNIDSVIYYYSGMWLILGCSELLNTTLEVDQRENNSNGICGYSTNVTSVCSSFLKARNLAYVCGITEIELAGAEFDVSKEQLPIEFLDYDLSLAPKQSATPMLIDFTENGDWDTAMEFKSGSSHVSFTDFEFKFNASRSSLVVISSTVSFKKCSFVTNGQSYEGREAVSVSSEGTGNSILIENCTIHEADLVDFQSLFSLKETTLTVLNSTIVNSHAPKSSGGSIFGIAENSIAYMMGVKVSNSSNVLLSVSSSSRVNMSDWDLRSVDSDSGSSSVKVDGSSVLEVDRVKLDGGKQFLKAVGLSNVTLRSSSFNELNGLTGLVIEADESRAVIEKCLFTNIEAENAAGVVKAAISTVEIRDSIFHNISAPDGGLIYAAFTSRIIMENSNISDVSGYSGGVAVLFSHSSIILDNTTISNVAATFGGIFYLNNKVTATILNCQVRDARVSTAGLVYAFGSSSALISNTLVERINATGQAGAVFIDDASTIESIRNLYRSIASDASGGVVVNHNIFTSDSDTFDTNTASGDGGVFVAQSCNTTITNATMVGNSAGGDGGALFASKSSVALTNTTIDGSSAGGDGGAISAISSAVSMSQVSLSHSEAAGDGGAIRSSDSSIEMSDVRIDDSAAMGYGGTISAYASTLEGTAVVIATSSAGNIGGTFYLEGGSLELHETNVTRGEATQGGGIYATGSYSVDMRECELRDCISTSNAGGGGAAVFLETGTVTMFNDSFINNTAMGGGVGGALILEQATGSSIADCEFRENTAAYGGAIFLASAADDCISSCTFEANKATYGGGGVFMLADLVDLNSSTFTSNSALYGANYSTTVRNMAVPSETVVNSGSLDFNLTISIRDNFGEQVKDEQDRRVVMSSIFQLIGATEERVHAGRCNFSQSGVLQDPGSVGTVQLHLSEDLVYGMYAPMSYAPAIQVKVGVLNCTREQVTAFNVCTECTTGQYIGPISHECVACPAHASCDGVHLLADDGFWGVFADKDVELYACPLDGACSSGDEYWKCNDGYEGVVCAICEDGYGPVGKTCAACGNIAIHAISLPLVTVIMVLILLAVVLFLSYRSGGDSAGTKILFNYCQTVAILAGLITLRKQQLGSSEVLGVFSAFTLDLNVISVECLFSLDYYDILWVLSGMTLLILFIPLMVWIPLILFGVFISLFGLLQLVEDENVKKYGKIALQYGISFMQFSNRYRNMLFIILYSLLLPRVAGHIMSLFSCVEIEETRYLTADYSIICNGAKYYLVMAYSILLFIVFVVGSLFFLFIGILTHNIASWRLGMYDDIEDTTKDAKEERKQSWYAEKLSLVLEYSPIHLKKGDKISSSEQQRRRLLDEFKGEGQWVQLLSYAIQAITFQEFETSLLYFQRGYKDTRFFWEIVVSIRKILILSAVVFSSDVVLKAIVILFLLVLFSVLQVITLPFKRRSDNLGEFISLLALIWVAVVVILHELYATDPGSYTRDVIIVFVLISSVVVPSGAMILYSFAMSDKKMKFRRPKGIAADNGKIKGGDEEGSDPSEEEMADLETESESESYTSEESSTSSKSFE